jgi:uncharacterized protein YraI
MSNVQQPQQPVQPPAQQPPAQPQQNKNIWWILGLVGLIILGVALVFAVFGGGETAAEGPVMTPPPPVPGVPSAVVVEAVNIRSGPDTAYPSYGVAPVGAAGEVIGVSENRAWWVIKLPTNVAADGLGWVAGQYVQVSNADAVPVIPAPPLPPVVEVPPPPANAPAAVALDAVNIRSGPGEEYLAYGVAAKGATGEVIGVSEDGAWWVVKLPTTVAANGQGWVSADWVSTSNTDNVPVIPNP